MIKANCYTCRSNARVRLHECSIGTKRLSGKTHLQIRRINRLYYPMRRGCIVIGEFVIDYFARFMTNAHLFILLSLNEVQNAAPP